MPHFLVSDDMPFHSKIVAAGNGAIGLWARAGAWSNHSANLTEGFIPTHIARAMGTPGQAKKLVQTALWHEVEGGYMFHEFVGPGRHRSREEILRLRRDRAEAGRVGGTRSGHSRGGRSEAHAQALASSKIEASASPRGGIDPAESSEKISHVRFSREQTENEESSADSAIESPLPADTPSWSEASASASAEAKSKQNRTPIPIPIDSGGVGRDRYVTNARDFSTGPPKFHQGHEDRYVPRCDECADTQRVWEAFLVEWAEQLPTEPTTRCAAHSDETGFVPPCRACRAAREAFEHWEVERAAARRVVAHHERTGRDECKLCDSYGWRIPPPELPDPPADHCDHTPRLPGAWRALIAELTDHTQETKAHV